MSSKRIFSIAVWVSGLLLTVMAGLVVSSMKASANIGDPGPYGTRLNYGYFTGRYEGSGVRVIPSGVSSNTVDEFVAAIRSWINSPDSNYKTGSRFIVNTMLGRNMAQANYNVTAADLDEWELRVRGTPSINFNEPYTFCTNSYYQRTIVDVAFYRPLAGEPPCWTPADSIDGFKVGNSIVFRDSSGTVLYAIRRVCGNPIGNPTGLKRPTYNLNASASASPSGQVEAGTTVNFTYTVSNTPGDPGRPSVAANCVIYAINRPGAVGGSPLPGPGDPSQTIACPSIAPNGTFTVPATGAFASVSAAANTTYCRRIDVSPPNQDGVPPSVAAEACVVVVSKPYAKVFGGDVLAGSGFTNDATCTTPDTNASVVGWNKRGAGAGAGSQYGGTSLGQLFDFATAQVNAGNATPPTGLSFSNKSTNAPNGIFGTSAGPSLPCLPDYSGQKPASGVTALGSSIDVGTLSTGTYSAGTGSGFVSLHGTLSAASPQIVLYVNGDLYIDSDISYGAGAWTPANMPLLRVVAKGNIFIRGGAGGTGVGRMDGIFIAQPNGGSGGTVYTCTDPAAPTTPLSLISAGNGIYNLCSKQLVVRGSVIGKQVELLRTNGSLGQSAVGESGANASEVFNYGPAFWLAQPPTGSADNTATDTYDSIVSLPPVL